MEYKKPQATIIQGNVGIYPLTTADQVILADGTRLEKDGKINVDVANSANSAKLGGKAPEYYLQPRNLLDNSDFRNPVNQRGQASYTGEYGIDRWRVWNSDTLTVNSGYITGNGYVFQYFLPSEVQNSVHTLAAKKTDGSILLYIKNPHEAYSVADNGLGLGLDTNVAVSLPTGSYLWAALYEGEYTAETLPYYQPKDIAQVRIACHRFFVRADAWRPIYGYASWNGEISLFLPTPTEMRINPTATTLKGTMYINGSSIDINETPANVIKTTQGLQIILRTKTLENSRHNCTLNLAETAAYFSADL